MLLETFRVWDNCYGKRRQLLAQTVEMPQLWRMVGSHPKLCVRCILWASNSVDEGSKLEPLNSNHDASRPPCTS